MATAFAETAKLAKRVREFDDVDAELEAYRQVCPCPPACLLHDATQVLQALSRTRKTPHHAVALP